MRVFLDAKAFETPLARGIQRIFVESLPRMKALAAVTFGLRAPATGAVPDSCRSYHAHLPPATRRWQLLRRAARLIQKRRWEHEIRCHDLFHTTYFTLPNSGAVPVVVTVYDMIPESFPDYYHDADQHVREKRAAVSAAAACICISESTAAELRAFYPEVGPKIRVIYPGCEHLKPAADVVSARPAQRDVLYVGERTRYKNFRTLLQAVADPTWPTGLRLCVVGRPFTEVEAVLISRLGLGARVQHLGRLTDQELAASYCRAACCVYPSLMEGFGFPVLEAQAAGCVVACSDIPVFREVAGGAAVFFDPRSPRAIAEAVGTAAESGTTPSFRDAARGNVGRFSWTRNAEQTLEVYQEVLSGPLSR